MENQEPNPELSTCSECGSEYFPAASKMNGLCPECAHILYEYENCNHEFAHNRCIYCYWDGSSSEYIKKLKKK